MEAQKMTGIKRTNRRAARCGAAVLLCTLAAAVLSLSAIAILRSSSHQRDQLASRREVAEARQAADALLARAVALIRVDPTISGPITDSGSTHPDARATITPDGSGNRSVHVFLYPGASEPIAHTVVPDPAAS